MSDEHTPTEEEARHDFANMQDWRYEERRAEFNRMLDVRDEALRAHCAAMVRGMVEEAVHAAYEASPNRYTPPSYLPGARIGMLAALDVIANKIEGKRK